MSANDALRGPDGRVYQGWKTALASMVGLLLSASTLTSMTFGAFVPYLIAEFGWSVATVSLGGMILSVMIMVVAPIQGLLIDRFGPRALILVSIPLFGLGLAALGLQTGALWQFYLGWFVLPILGLGLWPGSWVRATSDWFTVRLGLAMGIVNLGIGLGAAILPLLVAAIAEPFGWRSAYVALGLSSVAITWPVAWLWVRGTGQGGDVAARIEPDGDRLAQARKQPVFWLLLLAFILLGGLSGAVLINHVNILVERGFTREAAIQLQALLGAAMIVARLGTGWLLDKAPVTLVMPIFAVGGALALTLYALGATGGVAVVCAILLGLVVGAEMDVLGYAVRRYHGRRAFGALYGLLFAAFSLGSALGVAGMGIIHDLDGAYRSGLFVLASLSLAAALVLMSLGRYRFP